MVDFLRALFSADYITLNQVAEYVALFISLNFILILSILGYYIFGRSIVGVILMQIVGIILILLFFPYLVDFFSM